MRFVKSVLLSGLAVAVSNGAYALRINTVTYAGTGCKANSVGIAQSQNGDTVTFIFDSFMIGTTLGSADEKNSTCELRLQLDNPTHSALSLLKADVRGYRQVETGVIGSVSTNSSSNAVVQLLDPQKIYFSNPIADDYLTTTRTILLHPSLATVSLNFRADLVLASVYSDANGLLTVDSIDLSFQELI
jgi:Domain of unknown function (DUF4360)